MGVLNLTPDSFSDGGRFADPAAVVAVARDMIRLGATWLDLGAESSRPGARPVTVEEELQRLLPVLRALRAAALPVRISVDTRKGPVASAALAVGVAMINDIAAGADPQLLEAVAAHGAALCLMHMQGEPASMQHSPCYDDVVGEVIAALAAAMRRAEAAGVAREALVLDPGIGFGKTLAHNLALLRALPRLEAELDRPLLVGISRKSFIPALLERELPPSDRDLASHLIHAQLASHCALLRVHDVAGARDACRLALGIGS